MKDYGLVSIITPNYNCARFIEETIGTVQAQTYKNWELLIQDDCSTDGSYEIALALAKKDPRIKVERNKENSGAAVSRNSAIKRAQGHWIAFLDSDDLWVTSKLEYQLRWMDDNGADFSFAEYEHIDDEDNPMMVRAKAKRRITYRQMYFHCWTGCLTVMYKNDDNVGCITGPNVRSNNDYALFLKVLKTKKKAMGIPKCLAFYRIRKNGISRNKIRKIKPLYDVLHIYEGQNPLLCLIYILSNVIVKFTYKYKKIEKSDIDLIN